MADPKAALRRLTALIGAGAHLTDADLDDVAAEVVAAQRHLDAQAEAEEAAAEEPDPLLGAISRKLKPRFQSPEPTASATERDTGGGSAALNSDGLEAQLRAKLRIRPEGTR